MRRGHVATAPFLPVPGGVVRDGETESASPEGFFGLLDADASETLVVGDWNSLPEASFRGLHRVRRGQPRYPAADVLLEIAAMGASRDEFSSVDDLRPIYIREPDAAINWPDLQEGLWPGDAS